MTAKSAPGGGRLPGLPTAGSVALNSQFPPLTSARGRGDGRGAGGPKGQRFKESCLRKEGCVPSRKDRERNAPPPTSGVEDRMWPPGGDTDRTSPALAPPTPRGIPSPLAGSGRASSPPGCPHSGPVPAQPPLRPSFPPPGFPGPSPQPATRSRVRTASPAHAPARGPLWCSGGPLPAAP